MTTEVQRGACCGCELSSPGADRLDDRAAELRASTCKARHGAADEVVEGKLLERFCLFMHLKEGDHYNASDYSCTATEGDDCNASDSSYTALYGPLPAAQILTQLKLIDLVVWTMAFPLCLGLHVVRLLL